MERKEEERKRTTASDGASEAEQMCVYIHLTSFEANLHKVSLVVVVGEGNVSASEDSL
jgi:hypothetical protein